MTENDDLAVSPATGVVERLKGGLKKMAGTVIGDDTLRREGELHEQKAQALTEAQRVAADAERRQREADADRRAAELTAEQRELLAEQAAESRLEGIEEQHAKTQDTIEARHDRQREAAEDAARAAQSEIAAETARAARDRSRHQSEAAAIEAEAEAARARALEAEAARDELT